MRPPSNNIPGRFFADGIGLSCDEFPPATFIEGGTDARTICTLQAWQIYSGNPANNQNVGKWPLTPGTGQRAEQDWQASCHNFLRLALGVSSKKPKKGWGSVYPFSFTTTTTAATGSKAWVIKAGPSISVVSKRGLAPRTIAVPTATTMAITGDEELDLRWFNEMGRRGAESGPGVDNTLPPIAVRTLAPVIAVSPVPPNIGLPKRASPVRMAPRIPIAALYPRASDCTLDFDKEGLEDVEVGDDGFDDPLLEDDSKPQCDNAGLILETDLQACNDYLDAQGDDAYNSCCGGGTVTCGPILAQNGTASVNLCSDTEQCIGCAQLANYVEGIIGTCTVNGKVGGTQEVNEREGLTVEVDFIASG